MNLKSSWWVGELASGFKVHASLLNPWSILLFTVFIKSGRQLDSSSLTIFDKVSLNGPPTSWLPSPEN
jgi:hypothetical protein